MTERQLESRDSKSDRLRVFQVDSGRYYVESSQKKVCYQVTIEDNERTCACADFAMHAKEPGFTCKHILAVTNGNVQKYDLHEKGRMKLDKSFITNIKGKDFVVYEGLLDLAHQVGIKKSIAVPVQYPTQENGMVAVCQSYIETNDGRVFVEVGDASPSNVKKDVAPHIIRMAATRSKARAYRDLLNIGITCSVELSEADLYSDTSAGRDDSAGQRRPVRKETKAAEISKDTVKPPGSLGPVKKAIPETDGKGTASQDKVTDISTKAKSSEDTPKTDNKDKPGISQAQKNAIENLAKRRGIPPEEVKAMALKQFNTEPDSLTATEASSFIRYLQQAA